MLPSSLFVGEKDTNAATIRFLKGVGARACGAVWGLRDVDSDSIKPESWNLIHLGSIDALIELCELGGLIKPESRNLKDPHINRIRRALGLRHVPRLQPLKGAYLDHFPSTWASRRSLGHLGEHPIEPQH